MEFHAYLRWRLPSIFVHPMEFDAFNAKSNCDRLRHYWAINLTVTKKMADEHFTRMHCGQEIVSKSKLTSVEGEE